LERVSCLLQHVAVRCSTSHVRCSTSHVRCSASHVRCSASQAVAARRTSVAARRTSVAPRGWADPRQRPPRSRGRMQHDTPAHLLQGSWVTHGWLDRPLRIEEVCKWLRHSSIEVTQRYAHLSLESLPVPTSFPFQTSQHLLTGDPAALGRPAPRKQTRSAERVSTTRWLPECTKEEG